MGPVALGAVVKNPLVAKAVERTRRQRRGAPVLRASTNGLGGGDRGAGRTQGAGGRPKQNEGTGGERERRQWCGISPASDWGVHTSVKVARELRNSACVPR